MKLPKSVQKTNDSQPVPVLPFGQCLAKTRVMDGDVLPGRTVAEHCRITGEVARLLAGRVNARCPGLLPEGAHLPAQSHDIGKVCPTFQAKLQDAINAEKRMAMPALKDVDPTLERQWGGHAAVSFASLVACGAPESVGRMVGAHHGRPTVLQDAARESYGGSSWQEQRGQLLAQLLEGARWPDFTDADNARVVEGLTITADWIASGPAFDDPAVAWPPLVPQAVDEAGFCWPEPAKGLSFEDVFGFSPRPAQQSLMDAVCGPGIYVLEAPMGLGKTEAALYAAYKMLASRQACGLYFALPTQLTSNRIHHRVNAFLAKIFGDSGHAMLLHGNAWLERFLQQQMGMEAAPNHAWFEQGKRGILAPFGVGTVDQALFSAMHVRHGALRTFGLAGKVVILDEIHSYDAYTGTLLDLLVRQLGNIGCTVIILSATLTAQRRAQVIKGPDSTAYPLITAAPKGQPERAVECETPPESQVSLVHATDEDAQEEALRRAEQGQRVLWIENTVPNAQARYSALAARASAMENVPVALLHSRFTPLDRERNEREWTALFAHDAPGRGSSGCVLVGTQVVEQSLDLDADFLVSRFCPTDMLLQRLGRLWRHGGRTVRPRGAQHEAWLLHPPLEKALAAPQKAFESSGFVYSPYVLARSLEQWHALRSVCLPTDIRPLVEATYAARVESGPMAAALAALENERDNLRGMALGSASTVNTVADDGQFCPTRIGDTPTVNVLLVLSCKDGKMRLAGGQEVDLSANPHGSWKARATVAVALQQNMVRIPQWQAEGLEKADSKTELCASLKQWIHCERLCLGFVHEDGRVLRSDGITPANGARYDTRRGYMLISR